MKKKILSSILVSCMILSNITLSKAADLIPDTHKIESSNSERSYDSSFDLDFSKYKTWNVDFDNNGFAVFNHSTVTVKYLSNDLSGTSGYVQIELKIDEDKDGTYEPCAEDSQYVFSVKEGGSVQITLPHGNTVKNYRLAITNTNTAVKTGSFSVKTS